MNMNCKNSLQEKRRRRYIKMKEIGKNFGRNLEFLQINSTT
jgi:hypothetical protein